MISTSQLSARHDFIQSLKTVLRVMPQAPLLTAGLIGLSVLAPMLPDVREKKLLMFIWRMALWISLIGLTCHSQKARWAELNDEPWKASATDLARVLPVMVAWCEYTTAIFLGLMLLLIPGIVVAARGALLVPLVCIGKRGVVFATGESAKLTRGKFWLVSKYLLVPFILLILVTVIAPLIFAFIDASAMDDDAFSSLQWSLAHLPVSLALAAENLILSLILIATSVLQVNLYAAFKTAPP